MRNQHNYDDTDALHYLRWWGDKPKEEDLSSKDKSKKVNIWDKNLPSEDEKEWIAIPLKGHRGYIKLRLTMDEILIVLDVLAAKRIHCPKCGRPSLYIKKNGVWLATINVCDSRFKQRELDVLESHMENGKVAIAICLRCNHNREPFKYWGYIPEIPNGEIIRCKKCKSVNLSVYKKSADSERTFANDAHLYHVHNLCVNCLDCGQRQEIESNK